MGSPTARPKGELIMLGLFGLFLAAYLVDIQRLPMEGKIFSYVLAPFLIGFLLWCAFRAVFPRQKPSEEAELPSMTEEGTGEEGAEEVRAAPLGLIRTIVMACVLYASIYLFGFYFGTGLMLLLWFALFKRLDLTTVIISVATPLVLYVVFEHVMLFGLYEGFVIQLLTR